MHLLGFRHLDDKILHDRALLLLEKKLLGSSRLSSHVLFFYLICLSLGHFLIFPFLFSLNLLFTFVFFYLQVPLPMPSLSLLNLLFYDSLFFLFFLHQVIFHLLHFLLDNPDFIGQFFVFKNLLLII